MKPGGLFCAGLLLLLWTAPGLGVPAEAPDFVVNQCILADSLALSDLLGNPALLFFFDAGDRNSAPAYRYIRNWRLKYRGDNLAVIGFHVPGFKPLEDYANAVTAVADAELKIPIGMDFEGEVRAKYGIDTLPALVLIDPEGRIIFLTSDPDEYAMVEERIQELLREIKPGTALPFLFNPEEDPEGRKTQGAGAGPGPTPRILFGLAPGSIADVDSSGLGRYRLYSDSRGRERGKVYLSGRWRVDENVLTYTQSEESYLRIVYSGKDVWLLAEPVGNAAVKVVLQQDRSYLDPELWGRDIKAGREDQLPFIVMRYGIPKHIVSNAKPGTHELRLIPIEGEVNFYYIHFE